MCNFFGAILLFLSVYSIFSSINSIMNGEVLIATLWGIGFLFGLGAIAGIGDSMRRGGC